MSDNKQEQKRYPALEMAKRIAHSEIIEIDKSIRRIEEQQKHVDK